MKKVLIITTPTGAKYELKTTKNYTHVVFDKINLQERRDEIEKRGLRQTFAHWYSKGDCKDGKTCEEFVEHKISEYLAKIDALGTGEFSDDWFVCGYCSRFDLAEKLQKKYPNSVITPIQPLA